LKDDFAWFHYGALEILENLERLTSGSRATIPKGLLSHYSFYELVKSQEIATSSSWAIGLQTMFPQYYVVHQSPINLTSTSRANTSDVVIYSRSETNSFPLCILEFKKGSEIEKAKRQAVCYCIGSLELNRSVFPLFGLVSVCAGSIHVGIAVTGTKMRYIPIQAFDASSIGRFESCLGFILSNVHKYATNKAQDYAKPFKDVDLRSLDGDHGRVFTDSKRVIKFYDCSVYKDQIPENEVLEYLASIYYATEIRRKSFGDGVFYLEYPFFDGTASPSSVAHFIKILKDLVAFHDAGFVHGDIRLSNVMFADEPDLSFLIDFDLAGKEGQRKYPSRYSGDITDGVRHVHACPNSPLSKMHDLWSFGSIAAFFSCVQSAPWEAGIGFLKANDPGRTLESWFQISSESLYAL